MEVRLEYQQAKPYWGNNMDEIGYAAVVLVAIAFAWIIGGPGRGGYS